MSTETTAATTAALPAWIERYQAAWNGYDAGAIDDLLTEDVVWRDPALPAPARGRDAVREFMQYSWRAFPDLQFEDGDEAFMLRRGDALVLPWTMTATFTGPLDPPGFAPTGRRMTVSGVDLMKLRDERIADYTAYYDMNDVARQLGLMPPAGSGGERALARVQHLQARFMRRRAT